MGEPRLGNGELTQDEQAERLRQAEERGRGTSGPSVPDEEALLLEAFGAPDEDGVYGALGKTEGTDA